MSEDLQQATTVMLVRSRALVVTNDVEYQYAAKLYLEIKGRRKRIFDFFKPMKRLTDEAHKETCAKEKVVDDPERQAEMETSGKMNTYSKAKDDKQREESANALAESKRQEETVRVNQAVALEKAAEPELAQIVLDRKMAVVPPVLQSAVPKVEGLAHTEVWKFDVVDPEALVKAAAAGHVPITAVQPNTVFLGQMARSLKGLMSYPGVNVWSEKNVRGSGR